MRTIRNGVLVVPIVLMLGCSQEGANPASPVAPAAALAAQADAPRSEHSVTGSGLVSPFPGFSFTLTVSGHLDASGSARGTLHGRAVDTSAFGSLDHYIALGEIDCMRVVGNTAWIGFHTVRTAPGGSSVEAGAAWVVDNDGPGEDIAYSGPGWYVDPENKICSSTPPPMPPVAASPGNFTVR